MLRFRWAALLFPVLLLTLRAQYLATSHPSPDSIPVDVDRGAAGLSRWLHAIGTRASLIMITAHPDDEDGGMLAYQTRGLGARGALMSLTRGEGGQNAMSPDLYEALGLVRTQELLAAGRYYGVDQYWGTQIDYGFSKTREEALERWGRDRVLSDVVRVIRMTRPLVITSVFIGAATDGHGQHQVSGQMAQEAWLAASDPTKFPEQIAAGLRPWKALKIYGHVPFFNPTPQGIYDYAIDKFVPIRFFDYIRQTWSNEKPATNVEIPEGNYAPAPGLTYLQIGRQGLGQQRSQNHGVTIPPPVPYSSAYHRYDSRIPAAEHEQSFFDGIDISVEAIGTLAPNEPDYLKTGLAELARIATAANHDYHADRPQEIAPLLAQGLDTTRKLIDRVHTGHLDDVEFELRAKEDQYEHALAIALGLSLHSVVAPPSPNRGMFSGPVPTFTIAIPGQSFRVEADLTNGSPDPVSVNTVAVEAFDGRSWKIAPDGALPTTLAARAQSTVKFAVTAPADAALTRPHFIRPDEEAATYTITDPRFRNLSLPPYPLSASAEVTYHGIVVHLAQVVQTGQAINGLGVVLEPMIVGPPISVTVAPPAGAVPIGTKSFAFTCTVHSNVKGPAQGRVVLKLPAGWKSLPEFAPFSMQRDGEDRTITFFVEPGILQPGEHVITAAAEYQGHTFEEGYRLVGYPGLRPYPLYRPAVYRAVGVDVKTAPDLHIGYLPGTGDDVSTALQNLGVHVTTIGPTDSLSGFDAVIVGVRAYAVRPDLRAANNRLLDYVRNGGVLIVQYQLQNFDQNYGPHPFNLGANPQKVVDERAPVVLLKPDSPVFTWPNKINAADFDQWVEERGHGFMQTWAPDYDALLESHDPDQDPQKGGLLLAHYGKGAYIYDAFALYRQLPGGVPGAYRILANLVSLAKNPDFTGGAGRLQRR
jgi:LmbE family N-acetylglucosaminyl deacetylase